MRLIQLDKEQFINKYEELFGTALDGAKFDAIVGGDYNKTRLGGDWIQCAVLHLPTINKVEYGATKQPAEEYVGKDAAYLAFCRAGCVYGYKLGTDFEGRYKPQRDLEEDAAFF